MDQTVKLLGNSIVPFLLLFIGITNSLSAQGMYAEHKTQGTYFQFPTIIPYISNISDTLNTEYKKPYLYLSSPYDNCVSLLVNDSLVDQISLNSSTTMKYQLPIATKHFWPDSNEMNFSYRIESSFPLIPILHYPTSDSKYWFSDTPYKNQRACAISLISPIKYSKEYLIVDSPLGDRDGSAMGVGAISIVQSSSDNLITLKARLSTYKNGYIRIPKSTFVSFFVERHSYTTLKDSSGFSLSPRRLLQPMNWSLTGSTIRLMNLSFGYTFLPDGYDIYSGNLTALNLPSCVRTGTPFADIDFVSSFFQIDNGVVPFVDLHSLQDYYFFHRFPMQRVNILRFISVHDSTAVRFNGQLIATLDSAEFVDSCFFEESAIITANHPFAISRAGGIPFVIDSLNPAPIPAGVLTDTGMDSTQTISKALFATHSWKYANTFGVDLYTRSADTSSIRLNGQVLSGNWKPFALNPRWAYGRFFIPPGSHIIEGGQGFMAFHYGYHDNSYPYPDTVKFECYGHRLGPSSDEWKDSSDFSLRTLNSGLQSFQTFSDTLCLGDSLHVRAPKAHFTTWQWQVNGQTVATQQCERFRAPFQTISFQQAGAFWVKGADINGCIAADSVLVYVQNPPSASPTYEWQIDCGQLTLELQANSSSSDVQWVMPDGVNQNGSSLRLVAPAWSFPATLNLLLGKPGCQDSLALIINPSPFASELPAQLPNVITPNGDGQNDAFVFEGIEAFEGCYSLKVFNRWGALVYQSQSVNKPFTGLDQNGRPLSQGVYFFRLTLGEEERQGELHLFR